MNTTMKMAGNLLDEGKGKQRGILLLKGVRHLIGWALSHDPDPEDLRRYEGKMSITGTRAFEARAEDDALLALVVTVYRFIQEPEAIRRDKNVRFTTIEKSEVDEIIKALQRAAY